MGCAMARHAQRTRAQRSGRGKEFAPPLPADAGRRDAARGSSRRDATLPDGSSVADAGHVMAGMRHP
jgi:hypothetical protein